MKDTTPTISLRELSHAVTNECSCGGGGPDDPHTCGACLVYHRLANNTNMSLDVYLQGPLKKVECRCSCCGNKHEREEREEYYSRNITHNLNSMAGEAGIYEVLWRPDEIGITKAAQLIEPLKDGLANLESDPERFKKLNPSNGWGSYEGLVSFVRDYLRACEQTPDAEVYACR